MDGQITLAAMKRRQPPALSPVRQAVLGLPRLKKWRRYRKISQEKFAALIGVTQSMISQYERSKSDIPLSTVHQIAAALGITVRDLLGRDPIQGAEDISDVWARLPESEHRRAIRVLKGLYEPE